MENYKNSFFLRVLGYLVYLDDWRVLKVIGLVIKELWYYGRLYLGNEKFNKNCWDGKFILVEEESLNYLFWRIFIIYYWLIIFFWVIKFRNFVFGLLFIDFCYKLFSVFRLYLNSIIVKCKNILRVFNGGKK